MKGSVFYLVDAFTGELGERTLRGNPAAVVLLDEFLPDAQMQERANAFNLSETAFVVPRGKSQFDLRWFSPTVEVNLCGHATLATAKALQDGGQVWVGDTASFATKSGTVMAKIEAERIELNFPAQSVEEHEMPDGLASAFDWDKGQEEFAAKYPCFRAGEDWMVVVAQDELERARPHLGMLAKVEARGVVLTALPQSASTQLASLEIDFYSRFFGPRVGVDEDPVTGSAHTSLGPFWAGRLGKKKFKAAQLSARGGLLDVELRGTRVSIGGRAKIRAQGHLRD